MRILAGRRRGIDLNNMKSQIIVIAILVLISCNQDPDHNLKKEITDNKEIVGQWGIYSTSSDGVSNLFNVCPTVLFISEGTAFVTKPSGAIETFKWSLKKNKLTVSYISSIIGKTFPDTLYTTVFVKQNKQSQLEIQKIEGSYSFLLRKQP